MIRLQEPELLPYEDHSAWQATWSEEEELLAHTPPGYWHSLVIISQVKRALQWNLPVEVRLRFLEFLNDQVDIQLTLEAMQRVQPACDTAMKMLDEMEQLSRHDKTRLLMRWNVIANFCNLNPSLLEAMKLFSGHGRSARAGSA